MTPAPEQHTSPTAEPSQQEFTVIVDDDVVAIADQDGYELVSWQQDEWEANPSLVSPMVNAVHLAHSDPEGLVQMLHGPGGWPTQRDARSEPAWASEVAADE